MLKLVLIFSFAIWPFMVSAQKTPEDLGKYLFQYFKEGSISKIDSLVPTLEEMKALAEKIGLDKNSKQYADAVNGYDAAVEKFRENIIGIYSDTLDNKLAWRNADFIKVISSSDSMKIDDRDPASQTVIVTRLSVYFVHQSHNFRITVDDAFEINGFWKLGNNIYLKKLN